MRCPLCGGPVDSDGDGFVCQLGHKADGAEVDRSTDLKLAEALWMAVQALDNEADMLRVLAVGEARRFADEAEEQARLLRGFAQRHAPRVSRD